MNTNNINGNNINKSTFGLEKDNATGAYEEGKQKVDETYQQGKETVKNAYENGKDNAENMYNNVKESADNFYKESKEKIYGAQDCMENYADDLIEMVKKKPLTSLLIAATVGFVFSSMVKK
jgi:ElaB/YqjD/DUF883 family membrane-anchored ribosome-binding protein